MGAWSVYEVNGECCEMEGQRLQTLLAFLESGEGVHVENDLVS
jgi:hypothetical protein